MTNPTADIVRRAAAAFADALDRDDFATAATLLAPDCEYAISDAVHRGPQAIVATYAEASSWARRVFDEVRYESVVGEPSGADVAIDFIDYLMKVPGRWHRHRCRQSVTVSGAGMIVRIAHQEIPGERESLNAWFAELGIVR